MLIEVQVMWILIALVAIWVNKIRGYDSNTEVMGLLIIANTYVAVGMIGL